MSAIERRDPDYPALLARGILSLGVEDYAGAVEALEQFMTSNPSGRWQLRARNHLATAVLAASRPAPEEAP